MTKKEKQLTIIIIVLIIAIIALLCYHIYCLNVLTKTQTLIFQIQNEKNLLLSEKIETIRLLVEQTQSIIENNKVHGQYLSYKQVLIVLRVILLGL